MPVGPTRLYVETGSGRIMIERVRDHQWQLFSAGTIPVAFGAKGEPTGPRETVCVAFGTRNPDRLDRALSRAVGSMTMDEARRARALESIVMTTTMLNELLVGVLAEAGRINAEPTATGWLRADDIAEIRAFSPLHARRRTR